MTADTMTPEERLHATLDAAASAPVPDAWSTIRDRLADPPLTLDLRSPSPHGRRRSSTRVLSVAAGVLILLAGAVALLARDDDNGPPVVTGPTEATGWYIPVGLPEGWRVERASYDRHRSGVGPTVPSVTIDLVDPDGSRVGYILTTPGGPDAHDEHTVERPIQIPSQDLPVVALDRTDGAWVRDRYAGAWPGADLTGYVSIPSLNLSAMTPEELCTELTSPSTDGAKPVAEAALRGLISTLRPATTAEWRAFLATAETAAPVLSTVADLADLATAPAPARPTGPPPPVPNDGGSIACPPS